MPTQSIRTRKLQAECRDRRHGKHTVVPSLHLAGVWLSRRGFKVGDVVEIIEGDGLLVIQPLNDQSAALRRTTEEPESLPRTLKHLA